jgi:hypothetical protein
MILYWLWKSMGFILSRHGYGIDPMLQIRLTKDTQTAFQTLNSTLILEPLILFIFQKTRFGKLYCSWKQILTPSYPSSHLLDAYAIPVSISRSCLGACFLLIFFKILFLYYFDIIILKIIFLKKYYFNIYHIFKHPLMCYVIVCLHVTRTNTHFLIHK